MLISEEDNKLLFVILVLTFPANVLFELLELRLKPDANVLLIFVFLVGSREGLPKLLCYWLVLLVISVFDDILVADLDPGLELEECTPKPIKWDYISLLWSYEGVN